VWFCYSLRCLPDPYISSSLADYCKSKAIYGKDSPRVSVPPPSGGRRGGGRADSGTRMRVTYPPYPPPTSPRWGEARNITAPTYTPMRDVLFKKSLKDHCYLLMTQPGTFHFFPPYIFHRSCASLAQGLTQLPGSKAISAADTGLTKRTSSEKAELGAGYRPLRWRRPVCRSARRAGPRFRMALCCGDA
jgi:hypothetical protein